jgi:hypothetical protein
MEARLRELGFTRVRAVAWDDEVKVGSSRMLVLPFHGEQPSNDEVFHPDVRNVGNLYVVEWRGRRAALTVDAGSDVAGDTKRVARRAAASFGEVDVVFGGYRAWATYPIRFLFSSVSRYLLFVPRDQWMVRQKIMNDADDLLDVAERWGARAVVPYADGGAPWHWELGLGPRLDGAQGEDGDVHFDPTPSHVAEVAARRSSAKEGPVPSPVAVRVLRPGESLATGRDDLAIERTEGHEWPW